MPPMNAPAFQKFAALVLLLALAGAIGLAVVQYSRLGEVRWRIDRLDGRVNELLARESTGAGDEDDIAGRLDDLRRANEALGKRLDSIEAGDLEDLGLEDYVEQKVGETLGQGTTLNTRRPDLDRVAEYLGLSDRQRARVADIIDRSKDDVWKLMQETGADGRSLSEGVKEALTAPVAPEKKNEAMADQLFNHGPVGSEDSYFTHMMDIRAEALDTFQGTLTAEQQAKWKGMGFDLFAIQTGYTPFRKAVQEAVAGTR
jgi:hypothetical protein